MLLAKNRQISSVCASSNNSDNSNSNSSDNSNSDNSNSDNSNSDNSNSDNSNIPPHTCVDQHKRQLLREERAVAAAAAEFGGVSGWGKSSPSPRVGEAGCQSLIESARRTPLVRVVGMLPRLTSLGRRRRRRRRRFYTTHPKTCCCCFLSLPRRRPASARIPSFSLSPPPFFFLC